VLYSHGRLSINKSEKRRKNSLGHANKHKGFAQEEEAN
jgi:hypothetical protein